MPAARAPRQPSLLNPKSWQDDPWDLAPIVVGLDPSLTGFGVSTADWTGVIRFPKLKGEERLVALRDKVMAGCDGARLVVIEGYAYGRPNQAHQLGELGGVIRVALHEAGIAFVEVAPSARAKFATGKGNASKDAVLAAAVLAGAPVTDNNAADAWWLRQVGVALAGLDGGVAVTAPRQAVLDTLLAGQ